MKFHPRRIAAALSVAVLFSTAACGGGDPLDTDATAGDGSDAPSEHIVVGSANFPESQLLAEIYAAALEAQGVQVEKRLNIGSREVYLPALLDGSIDLLPEYTGALLSYLEKGEVEATSPEAVHDALLDALPQGVVALEPAEAEDKDAVVVTQETAEKHDLDSIEDLDGIAPGLIIGGPPENRDRRAGMVGLEDVYGLQFKEFKPLDVAGPLTVKALEDGTIDVAFLFSTQSAIPANDFVVLEDPENLFLAQNVIPVLNEGQASDTVRETLNAVSSALDTPILTDLVAKVELDKQDPARVAQDFLEKQGLA
jgi:osmoprotectant transport system substrate-binding protein